jgi:hypothetical protein
MTNFSTFIRIFSLTALISLLYTACDTTPASDKPEITPSSTTIRIGQSIQFSAVGGYEYTWRLENDLYGALSTRRGNTTVYTSLYNPDASNTLTQILYVDSTITGSSTSTNTSDYLQTGEAYITHVSTNI